MEKLLRNKLTICILVIPGVLLLVSGIISPIIMSVYLSMTDSQMSVSGSFIGLANYRDILGKDPVFWASLLHALMLCVSFMIVLQPVSLIFAHLLDRVGGIAEKTFRILFFIPCVIGVMVTSKMWINVLNPTFGLLNKLLSQIGLESLQRNWLSDQYITIYSVIFVILWQMIGWPMLVYYAGLKGIPGTLYEAAEMDGATGFVRHVHITIPMLMPVIKVNMVLSMISALKQMETIFLMTNGGPGDKSQVIANYLYQQAFRSYQYGYANAISVLFVAICLILSLVYMKAIRTEDHDM